PRPLRGTAGRAGGRPLPLARGRDDPRGARGLGDERRRRGDGRPSPRAADRWRAVPPGIGAYASRTRARAKLPGGMIQQALHHVLDGRDLSRDETREVMGEIMAGEATPAQIGGFLVALRAKGETANEIAGCAEAMRAHMLAVRPRRDDLVDTAGTG